MSCYAADNYKLHVDIGVQKFILAEGGLYCSAGAPTIYLKSASLHYQSAKLSRAAVCVTYSFYLATQGLCNHWTELLVLVPLFCNYDTLL